MINVLSRKDSFVTHRAFCDALTEENYRASQNLAASGGMLQNHTQELFTSSMPSSDSGTNANTVMNLSISTDNMENPMRPLSLSSAGVMLSSNLDPVLNSRIPQSCLSGTNASAMAIGSTYTSATALLQKAAEMGAKISDNTIAPILLKGFTGFSSSSTNSSGFIQEGSTMVVGNNGSIGGGSDGAYVEVLGRFDKNLEPGHARQDYNVSQTALFESQLLQSENGNAASGLGGEIHMGGAEKMTLDFLGVEPAGHSNIGKKRRYDGNIAGLGYSNGQQSLRNMHSQW